MGVIENNEYLTYVLIFGATVLIGYPILSWVFKQQSKKLPPGPREWGTSWQILKASWGGTMPLLACEWAEKYGEMTFVYSLGQPILFLNTPEVIRELLASDKYKYLVADRSEVAASKFAKLHGKDFLFSKFDAQMRKKRRMFYNVIGLYGDGVEKFENVVWTEAERMFAEIDKTEGKDTEITKILVRSLKVIIYILAMGERPSDPAITDILEDYDLALNELTKADMDMVLDILPFMAYVPGKFKRAVDRVVNAKKKSDEILYHGPKKTYVPNQPRGIADLLMDYRFRPKYEWWDQDEEHIIVFLTSLFMTAHLTSRASVIGTFLCLLHHPEVVKKVQKEVDSVIGNNQPKMEHRAIMPYCEAVILEGLRLISQVPVSGFRRASEDLDFKGMLIPKNTLIFMNNWYYLHDEKLWEDPWGFHPERFLDSTGQLLPLDHPRRRDLITFGLGLRACPGEKFARSRVFLFMIAILQRYNIYPPVNDVLPSSNFQIHDPHVQGLVRQSPPFKCRLVRRNKTTS